ncbi:hypothetical protein OESDEN_16037 [Oesophagostomum dentatum]|uniref:Uncharacterized protein n=1 Tax=Oesophagostomum dentatum TaxID=61180 RepID=A0A0B1SK43_OESDE|nr:hypothetical protein OESDEN_16037 [Oesophagostomum dentatum]
MMLGHAIPGRNGSIPLATSATTINSAIKNQRVVSGKMRHVYAREENHSACSMIGLPKS